MRAAALFLLLSPVLWSTAFGQQGVVLKANPQRAETLQGVVVLSWETVSEVGVIGFEVERSSPSTNNRFQVISGTTPLPSQGTSGTYIFRDEELYKSAASLARYRVSAVLQQGTRQELFQIEVNYTTTGIRRTWGSIKAMFQ